MSWRRFQVLVRCLSPNSATVSRLNAEGAFSKKKGDENLVVGAKNVDAAFDAQFKGLGQKRRQVVPAQAPS